MAFKSSKPRNPRATPHPLAHPSTYLPLPCRKEKQLRFSPSLEGE